MSHPAAAAARKFIRTAGVPSYEGYELQIRELADALDASMTDTTGPTLSEQARRNADDCEDQSRWATPELAPLLRELAAALDAQAALVKELSEALKDAEAVMSIIPPRTMKAKYLECLNIVRAALAKSEA